jgi:predicted PurR-regulated permease PerM
MEPIITPSLSPARLEARPAGQGATRTPGVMINRGIQILLGVVLAVTILYFGQSILVPFTLAVLLAMLLYPIVRRVEKWTGRVMGVVIVVLNIALAIVLMGWLVSLQVVSLANNVPRYQTQVLTKLQSLKRTGVEKGPIDKLQDAVTQIENAIAAQEPSKDAAAAGLGVQSAVHQVQIVKEPSARWMAVANALTSLANPLATLGIVTVLAIFLLIGREDVRDRLMRLVGTSRLTLTTNTIAEMGSRISRYLLMNALVNGGYGVAVTIGLLVIGVDYALLWGFLAATLRFLPYIGPIMGSAFAIGMAFVQFPTWTPTLVTAGYFIVLELITNNVIEPFAYGHSAGVSVVAILVAATFWTWVWGPIGLILSVPMTVMLAVLGKHVPQLQFLGIALGDEPALEDHVVYYQRLLANDYEEAAGLLEEARQTRSLVDVYDSILIPALVLAERDRSSGLLTTSQIEFIWNSTEEIIADLAQGSSKPDAAVESPKIAAYLFGCSVQDKADELALDMFSQLVEAQGGSLDMVTDTTLASELVESLRDRSPDVVYLSALGSGGVFQLRYLLKRIRLQHPDLSIVVARWGYPGSREKMDARMTDRGATRVITSLAEAISIAERTQPIKTEPAPVKSAG